MNVLSLVSRELRGRGLDRVLGGLEDRRGLLLAAEGLADHLERGLPRGAPGLARVGHDGRDLGELVVLLLGHAGVGGEDQVGRELGDLLDRGSVGVVVARRLLAAPREASFASYQGVESLALPPQVTLTAPTGATPSASAKSWSDQPRVATRVGGLADHGLAVDVLHGDGEGRGVGAGGARGARIVGRAAGAGRAGGQGEGEDSGRGGGETGAVHGGSLGQGILTKDSLTSPTTINARGVCR